MVPLSPKTPAVGLIFPSQITTACLERASARRASDPVCHLNSETDSHRRSRVMATPVSSPQASSSKTLDPQIVSLPALTYCSLRDTSVSPPLDRDSIEDSPPPRPRTKTPAPSGVSDATAGTAGIGFTRTVAIDVDSHTPPARSRAFPKSTLQVTPRRLFWFGFLFPPLWIAGTFWAFPFVSRACGSRKRPKDSQAEEGSSDGNSKRRSGIGRYVFAEKENRGGSEEGPKRDTGKQKAVHWDSYPPVGSVDIDAVEIRTLVRPACFLSLPVYLTTSSGHRRRGGPSDASTSSSSSPASSSSSRSLRSTPPNAIIRR